MKLLNNFPFLFYKLPLSKGRKRRKERNKIVTMDKKAAVYTSVWRGVYKRGGVVCFCVDLVQLRLKRYLNLEENILNLGSQDLVLDSF